MGNCPSEFRPHPTAIGHCVAPCPADKGFEYRVVNGVLKCVYKEDPSQGVNVNTLPNMGSSTRPGGTAPMGSYEVIKTSKPTLYNQYKEELTRFNNELAVVNANLDKTVKAQAAFRKLQAAENARDKAPEAYQAARMAYYTLIKGAGWAEEERARIARAEVDPVVNAYTARYTDVKRRMDQQQRTQEVVEAVKDKLLDVQDEFGRTVGVFGKQLSELKNQINVERRKKVEEVTSLWDILNMVLNGLLVVVLVYAVIMVGRTVYVRFRPNPPTQPSV